MKSWNWEEFLKIYTKILLIIFMIVLIINSCITFLNLDKAVKVSVEQAVNYNDQQVKILEDYDFITLEELEAKRKHQLRINIIATICIIGLISFHPESRERIKNLFKRFNEVVNK